MIYLKDINSDYVIFENNTFDSNIGIHGGCIHMDNGIQKDSSSTIDSEVAFLYLKNTLLHCLPNY